MLAVGGWCVGVLVCWHIVVRGCVRVVCVCVCVSENVGCSMCVGRLQYCDPLSTLSSTCDQQDADQVRPAPVARNPLRGVRKGVCRGLCGGFKEINDDH